MRIENVGDLIDRGVHWRLVYDCGHVQDFAYEGLADIGHATLYVRSHFPRCLSCASARTHEAFDESFNSGPSEVHLALSPEEMSQIIESLRQTGDRLLEQRFVKTLRLARRRSHRAAS